MKGFQDKHFCSAVAYTNYFSGCIFLFTFYCVCANNLFALFGFCKQDFLAPFQNNNGPFLLYFNLAMQQPEYRNSFNKLYFLPGST